MSESDLIPTGLESTDLDALVRGQFKPPRLSTPLLYSLAEFWPILEPLLRARQAKSLVEVGVEGGDFCRRLLRFCAETGAQYTGIDPSLDDVRKKVVADGGGKLILQTSHAALPSLPVADIYFIDGDHNYHTVHGELTTILTAAQAGDRSPILFLHDTRWPSARRDFYYRPDDIPQERRLDSLANGIVYPGIAGIASFGFRFEGLQVATREGGPRNGVLTAIEDVLASHPDWNFFDIPAVFGLGVLYRPGQVSPQVQQELKRLQDGLSLLAPLISRLETNRLELYLQVLQNQDLRRLERRQLEYRGLAEKRRAAQRKVAGLSGRLATTFRTVAKSVAAMRPGARRERFRFPEYARHFLRHKPCVERVRAGHASVICFDMFDTLVRRTVDPPDAVIERSMDFAWLLLRRNGFPWDRDLVRAARFIADETVRARRHVGAQSTEVTLEEILEGTWELLQCESIAKSLTPAVVDFELECEMRHLEAMPGAAAALAAAKKNGATVAVVSDIYLSSDHLWKLLRSVGLADSIDHVFTSADHRTGKYNGGLFRVVSEKLGASLESMHHCGDNILSDVLVPARLGMRARWVLNLKEHWRRVQLQRPSPERPSARQLHHWLESTRPARETEPPLEGTEKTLFEIGYRRLGPAFYCFLEQVAEEAAARGIEDIYFPARDGFGFMQVFDEVWEGLPTTRRLPKPRIHYAHVSRASAAVIMADRAGGLGLTLALAKDPRMTVGEFPEFCAFDPALVPDPKTFGLRPDLKIAEARESEPFRNWMAAVESSRELNLSTLQTKQNLRDYFADRGFFSAGPKALVDVGWNGTIPRLLEEVFRDDAHFPELHVFLLGKKDWPLPVGPLKCVTLHPGFLLDSDAHTDRPPVPADLPALVELAASAPHGTTLGYERRDGKVVPVLKATNPEGLTLQNALRGGWIAFVRDQANRAARRPIDVETFRKGATALLLDLYRHPSRREARAIAKLVFDMDWKSDTKLSLLGTGQGWRFYPRFSAGDLPEVTWLYGAAKLHGLPRWVTEAILFLRRRFA